jgi:hypothetical protein
MGSLAGCCPLHSVRSSGNSRFGCWPFLLVVLVIVILIVWLAEAVLAETRTYINGILSYVNVGKSLGVCVGHVPSVQTRRRQWLLTRPFTAFRWYRNVLITICVVYLGTDMFLQRKRNDPSLSILPPRLQAGHADAVPYASRSMLEPGLRILCDLLFVRICATLVH